MRSEREWFFHRTRVYVLQRLSSCILVWLMENGIAYWVPAQGLTYTTNVAQDYCQGVDQGFV